MEKKLIKGLYFKLNMDKARDRIIYNFFNTTEQPDTKIDAMYILINKYLSQDEVNELSMMNLEKDGAYHE